MNKQFFLRLMLLIFVFTIGSPLFADDAALWTQTAKNGETARETYLHCRDYVRGWLGFADRATGLIPRNINRDPYWNAQDAAADNYAFMVLASSLLDEDLYHGRMLNMLQTERRLTSRVGPLPDDFLFATQTFRRETIEMPAIIFGSSEYCKDGLLPLTEWLGPSPWMDRMIEMAEGIVERSEIQTSFGPIPAISHEVAGEMLQVLCRLYWLTKNDSFREMVFRISDYYLLEALPTHEKKLSLDDHGCEIIGGLSEAYYLASKIDTERLKTYKKPMHEMLDRVLEVARNENGLFYMLIDPVEGKVLNEELTDNWGYDYNAYLTVADVDNYKPYREAVRFALEHLANHWNYQWEGGVADGFADSIECAINLLNRIPVDSAFAWVDRNTGVMLAKQRDDGIIEGWHGDGNYTRTAIMYALMKTQGAIVRPWRADVRIGSVLRDGTLYTRVISDWPWSGRVYYDRPRHLENFGIPDDYPRLNQFPEWYTVRKEASYRLAQNDGEWHSISGDELRSGVWIETNRDKPVFLKVQAE